VPRLITQLAPFHGTRSVRVTVTWRKARIQSVRLEYVRPHLLTRMLGAAKR